jgi:hypothetical protein
MARKQRYGRLGVGYRVNWRRILTTVSIEDGSAATRESYRALILRASTFDLDKTVYEGVLPHSMSGARTVPRLRGFVIGPMTARDPGKKLQH